MFMNRNINKKLILIRLVIFLIIPSFAFLFIYWNTQQINQQNLLLENNQTTEQLSNNIISTITKKDWKKLDVLNCSVGDGDSLEHSQILKEFKERLINYNFDSFKVVSLGDKEIRISGITKTNQSIDIKFQVGINNTRPFIGEYKYKSMKCFNVIL